MTKQMRDVYQDVTDTIVRQIETGLNGGWRRPWRTVAGQAGGFPESIDGRPYRGMNVPMLLCAQNERDYGSAIWGTFKAWQKRNAMVRKGETATLVVFWKISAIVDEAGRPVLDDRGREKRAFWPRLYNVFNADQVGGWSAPEAPDAPEAPVGETAHGQAFADLSAYVVREEIDLAHGGNRACYSLAHDRISMPNQWQFDDDAAYLATAFHECGHSTGAKHRLDREFGRRFGDDAYAFEELVAELTAAFVCAKTGVAMPEMIDDSHAKYVANWLKVLRGDKRAIFTAASKAQAAADMILGEAAPKGKGMPKADPAPDPAPAPAPVVVDHRPAARPPSPAEAMPARAQLDGLVGKVRFKKQVDIAAPAGAALIRAVKDVSAMPKRTGRRPSAKRLDHTSADLETWLAVVAANGWRTDKARIRTRAALRKCHFPYPVYEAHLADGTVTRMSFWSPLKAGAPEAGRGRIHYFGPYAKAARLVDGYVDWNGIRVRDPVFAADATAVAA